MLKTHRQEQESQVVAAPESKQIFVVLAEFRAGTIF